MSIVIRTAQTSRNNGSGIIVAKANGKQRTVSIDPALSPDQNHAAAAGTLANVLLSPEQQAKVKHPSGRQRVRVEHTSDAGGHRQFTIKV